MTDIIYAIFLKEMGQKYKVYGEDFIRIEQELNKLAQTVNLDEVDGHLVLITRAIDLVKEFYNNLTERNYPADEVALYQSQIEKIIKFMETRMMEGLAIDKTEYEAYKNSEIRNDDTYLILKQMKVKNKKHKVAKSTKPENSKITNDDEFNLSNLPPLPKIPEQQINVDPIVKIDSSIMPSLPRALHETLHEKKESEPTITIKKSRK